MGYYTDFNFSNNSPEVIEAIEKISGYGESSSGEYSDIKWYSWPDHMREVSLLFPYVLIEISGEGGEQGDIWEAYFKNGKSTVIRPEVTFPAFDESMLK